MMLKDGVEYDFKEGDRIMVKRGGSFTPRFDIEATFQSWTMGGMVRFRSLRGERGLVHPRNISRVTSDAPMSPESNGHTPSLFKPEPRIFATMADVRRLYNTPQVYLHGFYDPSELRVILESLEKQASVLAIKNAPVGDT